MCSRCALVLSSRGVCTSTDATHQTFGFIFGLSDAIIGLTVFAVGNSLADLVANMSVAVRPLFSSPVSAVN